MELPIEICMAGTIGIGLIILFLLANSAGGSTNKYANIPPPPRSREFYELVYAEHYESFNSASPVPHVVIDNFFPEELVREVAASFPVYSSNNVTIGEGWFVSAMNAQYLKVETSEEYATPAALFLINHMKSSDFILFLQAMSGIPGLVPDPFGYGAGLHHTLHSGRLAVHLDYNYNEHIHMWRRINVFLYLNEGWKEEWNGHLELWNDDMSEVEVKILPLFNRLVIFEASESSWHGHPEPLLCPFNTSRNSIAMYYYTAHDNPLWHREKRQTLFMPRANIDTWSPEQRYENVV